MDYVIIGGDARFGWLARLLRERGEAVGTVFREPARDVPALDLPALVRTKRAVVNVPPRIDGAKLSFDELLALQDRLECDLYITLPDEYGQRRVFLYDP